MLLTPNFNSNNEHVCKKQLDCYVKLIPGGEMNDSKQNQAVRARFRTWYIALGVFAVIAMFYALLPNGFNRATRTPIRYFFPRGYVGKYRIDFTVKNAPPLPVKDGFIIVRIPPTGRLQTSSLPQEGWAYDEFYYVSPDGKWQQLSLNGKDSIVQEQSIGQGQTLSPSGEAITEPLNLEGFIGTAEQHKKFYGY